MRLTLPAVLFLVTIGCISGCAQRGRQSLLSEQNSAHEQAISPSTREAYWEHISKLRAELPRADRSLLEDLAPPGPADEAYVAQLDRQIVSLSRQYVERHLDLWREPSDQPKTKVTAARKVGPYILLDVQRFGMKDGNVHLVYSLKDQRVLGWFCWYVQG